MKIASLLLMVVIMGCSDGSPNIKYVADSVTVGQTAPPPVTEINTIVDDNSEIEQQKIIKTAQLSFETKDMEATYQKIIQLTNQYKGLVQSDNNRKGYNRIFKNLVIHVPSKNFQQLIDSISDGVDYFDQKDISRQDVSKEFVDLKARLKAKRKLENRYLELLKKANNVKDMLDIESELSKIREEIETRQGRAQFLQNRVSMSTVTIEFYKITTETGITQSYGQKIKNAFQGGWNGISIFFLGVLYLWPLFLVTIIIVILLRIYLKNKKKKH